MESVWYYVVNGVQTGPVTLAELKEASSSGKLSPDDLVWKEGTPDWVPARAVPELFPSAAAPPRPPAPPTYGLTPPARSPEADPALSLTMAPEPLPLDDEPGAGRTRPRRDRDRDRDDDEAPAGAPDWVNLIQVFFRRTFNPDPSKAGPTHDEDAALTRAGVMDPTARRLAAWRRAVLFVSAVPCAFAALLSLIDVAAMKEEERNALSSLGLFLFYVQALATFALPVAAVFGALAYDRLSVSVMWVLIGGLVSFGVPLAIAFVPSDWFIDLKTTSTTTVAQLEMAKGAIGLLFGIQFYLMLMPAVLSLLPAVARACVRLKLLVPESLVPGWGLVASTPLCVLLTLAAYVLLYHVIGNPLLIIGLLLWVGAPLLYLSRFGLLTRPITTPAERAALGATSLGVLALMFLGVILLVIFLFTAKLRLALEPGMSEPKTLMGFDKSSSMFRPWNIDLHKLWIEYLGRSLFLSVFFGDLLLRMALSVWREERAFVGTDGAAGYDRTMTGLDSAILPRGNAPPTE